MDHKRRNGTEILSRSPDATNDIAPRLPVFERRGPDSRAPFLPDEDLLTGLPGRRKFQRSVEQATMRAGRADGNFAFLTLDLDNFRLLNNSYSHAVGDEVLVAVAERLNFLLDRFSILGRLDGNKFAVLLPALDRSGVRATGQAAEIANWLREAIGIKFVFGPRQHKISCSVGVYVFGNEVKDPHRIFKCAETAMYEAKSGGKDQVRIFESGMLDGLETAATLVPELRTAIDDTALELKYQPQTDCHGRTIGAEALIRWRHSQYGNVPPEVFIPVAEENGLIIPITDWVLEQALDTLVRWQRHPQLRNLSLAVNISAQQFHQREFLEKLRYFASYYDIDLSRLVLELTERVFFGDMDMVRVVMRGLRELGIRLSLDDYGTGYSSLAQLRHLEFDELKIDGTFIREICTNESDRAIVRTTLAMARALNVKCVAEWVENEEQRRFLCLEGCDYLQGHLFGPAVPLSQFEKRVLREIMEPANRNVRNAGVRHPGAEPRSAAAV